MPLKDYKNGDRYVNKIALTFDDGVNPFWTRKVIDLLDDNGIKGNFFVLGKRAEAYPELVKEEFDRGHLVGNHSYSHPFEGDGDFEKAEKILFNIIGEYTKFIRPPYNNISLCNRYAPAINGEVKIVNNDVVPRDWESNSEDIINIVLESTKNGSIILLHDGSQRDGEIENRPQEMFKALPTIIRELKKKNFDFVTLNELL
jgi:peptidoglycan-N-acetylglucosamine deacetylase